MFLLNWYREYLEIRAEKLMCHNCDYLKQQLEIERQFNKVLFEKLTVKEQTPVPTPTSEEKVPLQRQVPWRVKRQMLEAESRAAASKLREFKDQNERKSSETDVEKIEQQIGIK